MNPLFFPDDILVKFPVLFDYEESNSVEKFVTYILNSKYSTAVRLKEWIQTQVKTGVENYSFSTVNDNKCDKIMNDMLNYVINTVTYKTDKARWNIDEYWQTPGETLLNKTGDCEDGAILMYVMSRLAGVSADRLWLCCADVADSNNPGSTTGHCFLLYEPDNYPINWCIIDWCYWPDKRPIAERDFYTIVGNKFFRSVKQPDGINWRDAPTNYVQAWFFFSELKSTLLLNHKPYFR